MTVEFTHLDRNGTARMVDVSPKAPMRRTARAQAAIVLQPGTIDAIREKALPKGDVLTVAKIAGVNAAKKNAEIIPLCHTIPLDMVDVDFQVDDDRIIIKSVARCVGRTGVEMEALAAAVGAAMGIYDMCKAIDKSMVITDIRLLEKTKEELS
ncbi:MAG: cyclic pyranopterin monophosphate synthase MoaC [Spirochaetaceae bacterium]|nr:cyclic pyranopterin monophosphate synthase MoaC [Spirochaetaceae bacterium]